MQRLDGKEIARRLREEAARQTADYRSKGIVPTLAIVTATEDPGAIWYVRSLEKAAEASGIDAQLVQLDPQADTMTISRELQRLAEDPAVHGIILQVPLPDGVELDRLLPLIPPEKDVDGASPVTAGRLWYGLRAFAPATAEAVLLILKQYEIPLEGSHAVVIGRSRVVGKPVADLLLSQNATVTICHSRTTNLADYTKQADILVVATGKIGLITSEYVNPEQVVIDVGTNVDAAGKLVGDVALEVAGIVKALTPVPGGVGTVTTALILQHTLAAVSKTTSNN